MQQLLIWINNNPKNLFKLDGFGAMLSAVMLGIVLVRMESVFGIPKSALYILATLPCFFSIYDLYCYFKVDKNMGTYLKIIAISNLLYCCLSIGLGMYHKAVITTLGWMYILIEILIIGILAIIELGVAKKLKQN